MFSGGGFSETPYSTLRSTGLTKFQALTVASTAVAKVFKLISVTKLVASLSSTSLTRQVNKILSALSTTAVTLSKVIGAVKSVAAAATLSAAKLISLTKSVASTVTTKVVKLISLTKAIVASSVTTLIKSIRLIRSISASSVVTYAKAIYKIIPIYVTASYISISHTAFHYVSLIYNSDVAIKLTRFLSITKLVVAVSAAKVVRLILITKKIGVAATNVLSYTIRHLLALSVACRVQIRVGVGYFITLVTSAQSIIVMFHQLAKPLQLDTRYLAYIGERFYVAYSNIRDYVARILR